MSTVSQERLQALAAEIRRRSPDIDADEVESMMQDIIDAGLLDVPSVEETVNLLEAFRREQADEFDDLDDEFDDLDDDEIVSAGTCRNCGSALNSEEADYQDGFCASCWNAEPDDLNAIWEDDEVSA